jgi:uncharacterized protein (TIGR02611 family)
MVMENPPRRPRPKLIEKLEAQRESHRDRSLPYRIAFGVVGAVVLLAGLIMLVTPGPAFVLIPIGLAILSLEFAWAAAALEKALDQAQSAQEKAANASPAQRALGVGAFLLAVAAAVVAAAHWNVGPF